MITWIRKRIAYSIVDVYMQMLDVGIIKEIKIPYQTWPLKLVPKLLGWKPMDGPNAVQMLRVSSQGEGEDAG